MAALWEMVLPLLFRDCKISYPNMQPRFLAQLGQRLGSGQQKPDAALRAKLAEVTRELLKMRPGPNSVVFRNLNHRPL